MTVYVKRIIYFGRPSILACDGKCSHAWGLNNRTRTQHTSDDPDDVSWVPDDEAGPCNLPLMQLGSEGGDLKPDSPDSVNKWCARSCERSVLVHEDGGTIRIRLNDWSRRVYNQPWKHQ